MAERHGARPLTQRKFEDVAPPAAPEVEPRPEPGGPTDASPGPARPPIRREPSDLELRERQLKWLRERERVR